MAPTTVLIPVGDERELLEWLEGFGLLPVGRAPCYPTLGELRSAARSAKPTELREHYSQGTWYADLLYGPVQKAASGQSHYAGGGSELSARVDCLDDHAVTSSVGFRGGHDALEAIAEAIAEAVGPVVTVDGSSGTPRLHGNG